MEKGVTDLTTAAKNVLVNSKVLVSCTFSNIKSVIFATQPEDSKDDEVEIIEKSSKVSDAQPEMQLELDGDESDKGVSRVSHEMSQQARGKKGDCARITGTS
jgi:hypothetical protein